MDYLYVLNTEFKLRCINPAGLCRRNAIVLTSMRRHHVASTSIRRQYDIISTLCACWEPGEMCKQGERRCHCRSCYLSHFSKWDRLLRKQLALSLSYKVSQRCVLSPAQRTKEKDMFCLRKISRSFLQELRSSSTFCERSA